MTCIRCNHDSAKKFGFYGKRHIRRFRCKSCRITFAEPHAKIGNHYTEPAKVEQALTMMLEGMSVRAISRITGLHLQTVLALMNTAATKAQGVFDALVKNVQCKRIQADEVWGFVGKKQRSVRKTDSPEVGDCWLFVAIDPETKLIASFVTGKRSVETTNRFLTDLRSRLSSDRFQLTTDGYYTYRRGVENVFAGQADFAQLIKLYGDYGQHGQERYSPSPIMEVISKVRDGRPDPKHICTSHIERSNLSLRMHLRRYTRLSNAFSKTLNNHKAALALYITWYNFCRVHQTIRVTPAMQAGITDHVWSLSELLAA